MRFEGKKTPVDLWLPGQYNASKAAVNMFSETLRYELAPLHVRVITLVAGNVASHMSAGVNGPPPASLPAASRYKAVEAELMEVSMLSERGTADAEELGVTPRRMADVLAET